MSQCFSLKGRIIAAMVVIGVAFCGSSRGPAEAAGKLQPSFFGSMEIRSENLKPFTKWRTALERYSEETAKERTGTCKATMFNICHYEELRRFLDGIRNKDRWDQLVEVNHYMNTRRYITDPRNWGVPDYWESPGEFMAKFGDCEDYAIAKFLSLKRLGWTDDELRVAAVKDLNLNVGHAVLIVYYGGKTWVLDNQIRRVVATASIRHYQPVYSINETSWWRHRV
jgi:predicted transglutaminase-like cysteine proteinase